MKVLQILPSLEVGGVERGVIDLVRDMKQRGLQSVVISSGGRLVNELQKIGIPHYTLAVHKKSLLSLRLIPKLVKIIRSEQIDIVHARSRVPGWLVWVAAIQAGVPLVTTCHGYYSNHFLSKVMGWGKLVVVISRIIGRHMIDDFGVSPERIRLIHRGIDLKEFQYKPRDFSKPKSTYRIINVGRLSPIKGQLEFLQAIHRLRQKMSNIEVLLVGAEGKGKTKYTEELKALIAKLGLDSCVKLLGTRRDIPDLIASSDLLVLSTLVPEAFGRVLVEAGAIGTPVLSTRVGGVLDIIDHKQNGHLVPPGDAEAMANGILEILSQPELGKKYSEQLLTKVRKYFTLEQMMDKTIDVYREVLSQKKILVIKLGAMGDVILGTPSFRMIRERYPNAHIALLIDKKLMSLVSACPYFNEIIPVDRARLSKFQYLMKQAKKIRRERFDLSIDFQNSKWTHLLAAAAFISKRYGFRRGKFGFLINRHDRNFALADSPVKHQFRILSKLGIQRLDEELELWTDEESERYISEKLSQNGVEHDTVLVGFVIGSSPKWPTKRWPVESFEQLGRELAKDPKCKIILIGPEEDRERSKTIKNSNDQVIDFIGQTTLKQLISLVKKMNVIVTGDTAPLHIAAAVKTKFVTLFGPTDAKRHVPPSNNGIVIQKHLSCQPCYKGQCFEKDYLACLKKISVDEVLTAVNKQLVS